MTKLVFEYCFTKDEQFYSRLETKSILTLNELTIYELYQPEKFTKRILKKCPNLKKLKLLYLFEGAFKYISVCCPSLVSLSVSEISYSLDTDSNLAHLRHLKVGTFSRKWLSLVLSCPSIETLDVGFVSEIQILEKEFDVVFQEIRLSHLILESRCSHCDIFVNKNYKTNIEKVKSLRLNFASIHDLVMFELSLDESQWSVEDFELLKFQILKNYPESGELNIEKCKV